MNKFTLKFSNHDLEKQYQKEKQKVKKYVFYLFMVMGLLLNLSKIIIDQLQAQPKPQLVNYILLGLIIVLVLTSVKWPEYIQYTLAIANISTGLLQLNFTPDTPVQNYFSYGSNYMQIQVCAFFVSDFQNSLAQLFLISGMKLGVTIYLSPSFDPMNALMTAFAPIILSIVVYICDSNSRNQFLQNIGEDIWEKRLPDLIKKPFFKIFFNSTMLNFSVTTFSQLDAFPGFMTDYCIGCNVRNLLRIYKDSNKITLEKALLQKRLESFFVVSKGQKLNLRICNYGIEESNYIVILDREITQTKQLSLVGKQVVNSMLQQTSHNRKQQFFNWGVISLMLINDNQISSIDLLKNLRNLNIKFERRQKIQFLLECEGEVHYKGYTNLLKIYLIQLYLIISHVCEIQQKFLKKFGKNNENSIIIKLLLQKEQDAITLRLPSSLNSFLFLRQYQNNIFINQVENILLVAPLLQDLQVHFNQFQPFF